VGAVTIIGATKIPETDRAGPWCFYGISAGGGGEARGL